MPKTDQRKVNDVTQPANYVFKTNIIDRIRKAKKLPYPEILPYVMVTVDMANDLISLNTGNRAAALHTVNKYAEDMARGNWFPFVNMLKIDENGRLIDGQQELLAIIRSGKPQMFHIQTNLDPRCYAVVDTGRNKSIADTLRTAGYKNPNQLGAAVRTIIYLTKYRRIADTVGYGKAVDGKTVLAWCNKDAGNTRLVHECNNHAMSILHNKKKGDFLTLSSWAALYYIFTKINSEDATYFCDRLSDGDGLSSTGKDRAIYLLRQELQYLSADAKKRKARGGARGKEGEGSSRSRDIRYRLIMRGWNAWRNKEKIKDLVPELESPDIEKPV